MVDWGRGHRVYHPVAPRPSMYGLFVHRLLVPPVISRGAPYDRPLLMKDGIGREMAGQFGLRFRLPRKSQGSFTCSKSATWDRRLYFPSEGGLLCILLLLLPLQPTVCFSLLTDSLVSTVKNLRVP
jgi:hypothetical protein